MPTQVHRSTMPISAIAAAFVFVASLLAGCSGSEETGTTNTGESTDNPVMEREECRKRVDSAIGLLSPESFFLSVRPATAVNALNAWAKNCAEAELTESTISEANAALLSPSALRTATTPRFSGNDASAVSLAILARKMADSIWEMDSNESVSETDRIDILFNRVVRNLSLLPEKSERPPVGLFHSLLTGRGSFHDRAWLFGEILRQKQIDAFFIQSTAPESDATELLATSAGLIAVLTTDGIRFYDPEIGLSAAEDTTAEKVLTHPRWKDSPWQVIAASSVFSPRMLALQTQLDASQAVILYEELAGGTSEIIPLTERLNEALGTIENSPPLTVWEYPDLQTAAASSLNEQQQKAFRDMMRPFSAPFERRPLDIGESLEDVFITEDELTDEQKAERRRERLAAEFNEIVQSSDSLFGEPSRKLLRSRILQTTSPTELRVIQEMQNIRAATNEEFLEVRRPTETGEELIRIPLPETIRSVHDRATGSALYWTALCQLERGDAGTAAATFSNYRRQYPEGRWRYPSLIHQALAEREQGRTDAALATLATADQADNPEQRRVQLLTALWSEAQ